MVFQWRVDPSDPNTVQETCCICISGKRTHSSDNPNSWIDAEDKSNVITRKGTCFPLCCT